MGGFDEAAVDTLMNAVVSHAESTGYFEEVMAHEPKQAPGNGLVAAFWVDAIRPVNSSGLNSTSALVVLLVRVYQNMLADPQDDTDPSLLKATTNLISAYCGDLELGDTVRSIDVRGIEGTPMTAQTGNMNIDNRMYRAMDITVPVILNDAWTEVD